MLYRGATSGVLSVAVLALVFGRGPSKTFASEQRPPNVAPLAFPAKPTPVDGPAKPPSADHASVNPPRINSPKVWRVDRTGSLESYSNGLRIDVSFAVSNRPRGSYAVYSESGAASPARYATQPVGIVYHTTESDLAPFEEDQTKRLKQLGRNLIDGIRMQRSYHYVIDRFGRVFRVVEESDVANHSGYSVWGDANGIYVNLNKSFLAIAFEGQTGATDEMTPAQILAGRLLTEMLRARYSIPAEDCVTHAQVSVNPNNLQIGEHTDWASQFPFAAVGLPDNYALAPASLYAFGFEYSDAFMRVISPNGEHAGWAGLAAAQRQLAGRAAAAGMPEARYRAVLRQRYKEIFTALEQQEQQQQIEGGS